jgi:hypothetical protein
LPVRQTSAIESHATKWRWRIESLKQAGGLRYYIHMRTLLSLVLLDLPGHGQSGAPKDYAKVEI